MISHNGLIAFMDLLDLDEEVIDRRLSTLMDRSNFTDKHLSNAIHLLRYKQLINVQEDSACDNDKEYSFVSKLINNLQEDNVDNICEIVNIVLSLNPNSLVSKSEHLIQQILSSIELPSQHLNKTSNNENEQYLKALFNLKICTSILKAVISNGQSLSLSFLQVPLENILFSAQETLIAYFLTSTVPLFFKGVYGYGILDRIWNCIIQFKDNKEICLKTLSCLSNYYLPIAENKELALESNVVFKNEFWELILEGLMSEISESSKRRMSTYLAKRAIDYLILCKKDAHVKSQDNTIFKWEHKSEKQLKAMWDNFFILMDSLEEKQSNIVLPSLQLLDVLKDLTECWLNCVYNMGLKHDNTQVRLKCIEYRLKTKINGKSEVLTLLEALNDTYLFDQYKEYSILKNKLYNVFSDLKILMCILKTMPSIKWSPVPLFHLSEVLASVRKDLLTNYNQEDVSQVMISILKIPCNNILLRKAIHVNFSHLVGNCCRGFHWKEYMNLYSYFQFDSYTEESRNSNPLIMYLKENSLIQGNDIHSLFLSMTVMQKNIDFGLVYIETHPVDVTELLTLINKLIFNIQDVNQRQFADKIECLKDVISLTNIFSKTTRKNNPAIENINMVTATSYKTILEYLISLLSSDKNLNIEEVNALLQGLKPMVTTLNDCNAIEIVLHVYKSCILLVEDTDVAIEKKNLSIQILCILLMSPLMNDYHKHEILNLNKFLNLSIHLELLVGNIKETSGKLKNVLYEKYCEILYYIINNNLSTINLLMKEFLIFIDNATECGGYGCLIWILKVMKRVLPELLEHKDFDISIFLNRMWKEIEELKSNNQYTICIEEFVKIITDDAVLDRPIYNNIILSYCFRIIEYGSIKNSPLFFLIRQINDKDLSKLSHIVYALCEILLFSPIPRKDQRIAENLSIEILNLPKYGIDNTNLDVHFNFHIQYLSYCALSKIDNPEILNTIIVFITNKINDMFSNKKRYHGNSQSHRTLLSAMQNLLLILLKSRDVNMDKTAKWCMHLLGACPHQPSVRVCLEWYIALYFCFKEVKITEQMLQEIKSNNIPLTSQFLILYWIIKFKIKHGPLKSEEYEFVMDTLLFHTMGQIFNLRLHAQYLASKLYELNEQKIEKYDFIITVIQKTFAESAGDKGYLRLQKDYFSNDFDLVIDFIPSFIYYFLPRYCEMFVNEKIDKNFIKNILQEIDDHSFAKVSSSVFKTEWTKYEMRSDDVCDCFVTDVKTFNDQESLMGTIQKKYVPWKNMNDVNMYELKDKKVNSGELIVVASLIDKLPNLGGLARTSEVFGVKTYVVDSLRHLQDKQFQGLSVSAERWINVEEVRPNGLKGYLMEKKIEGYSVVAAEQTSNSCQLQTFKFPKKTLLLLGHEKEGVPCDLLPLMDYCVEIPQQGVVRSLNVHVTAAIFVWEYTRQIML